MDKIVSTDVKFSKRGKSNKKKVLIYGRDGTGKSTFAEEYCKENGLKAVVLDIEDTNYTGLPMISDFDLSSDVKAYRGLNRILKQVEGMSDVDTLIIDGVDALIEAFISSANGLKCYADRSKTFLKFLRDCMGTGKNLIFVGQSPCDLDWYKADENPNKCIIKLNSLVNEKYRTVRSGSGANVKYTHETTKYRG